MLPYGDRHLERNSRRGNSKDRIPGLIIPLEENRPSDILPGHQSYLAQRSNQNILRLSG